MSKLEKGVNDLETFCNNNQRVDLLEEWDYKKNGNIKPDDVCYGAAKKVWWIGKCGHSYQASLNRRTSGNTGCPYCCNSHAKLLPGFNDLATTNPELLDYWDYDKNTELKPCDVMKGQHKKVWWKCDIGHSYQAAIYHRTQGRGCPICRRENQTSFPEQALFFYIKEVFSDALSTDREALSGKELDIYIPSKKIAVEFDGSKWHKNIDKDVVKDILCEEAGISLIRIRDVDCPKLPDRDNVYIIHHNDYSDGELVRCIERVFEILNISVDIDLDRDRTQIYNLYLVQKKEKSLADSYPGLCEEWNYDRNGELTPRLITRKSDKKVWWKGKCGHEWQAVVSTRTNGVGCPYCNSNRLLKGFNDLGTQYPQLADIFDSEKNEITVSEISPNQQISLYWKCSKGHSYKRNLKTMLKYIDDLDTACPLCNESLYKSNAGKKRLKNDSDKKKIKKQGGWRKSLSFTVDISNPECLSEWDYEKNTINPNEITVGSDIKIWWKCSNGHSYDASPSNHISLHRGCPYCSGRKILKGYNDLASQKPDLIKEWDYERNMSLKPDEVTVHSGKKVWWKCSKGHSWKAVIDTRSNGVGCPICAGIGKKSVRNIDTGEVFSSLSEAALSCGLKVGDTISLCCKGKQKMAGGYHWEYIDDNQ